MDYPSVTSGSDQNVSNYIAYLVNFTSTVKIRAFVVV